MSGRHDRTNTWRTCRFRNLNSCVSICSPPRIGCAVSRTARFRACRARPFLAKRKYRHFIITGRVLRKNSLKVLVPRKRDLGLSGVFQLPFRCYDFEFDPESVHQLVDDSQPRGRHTGCLSGVCDRRRPGARHQRQMDRKDLHHNCGQGGGHWPKGRGTWDKPALLEKDLMIDITGQNGRRFWGVTTLSGAGGEDRRTVHRRAYWQGHRRLLPALGTSIINASAHNSQT